MNKDNEYWCMSTAERIYLRDNGVKYAFVKVQDGVTIYKYRKTAKLFQVLNKFYEELGILE